jgi:thiol-disulfide isomerase/thioredoxin
MRSLTMTALAICLVALPAFAAALGDPAPPLSIGTWLKGGPVEVGEDKGVVVVEFWATWCPPCKDSIPHLTELQKQYADKGVSIVGITDEEEGTVRPFVEQMGDQMGYAVAIDDEGKTGQAYMAAFGVQTIPHAFVVDGKGLIVWHGMPMELDDVLAKVVDGTYDAKRQQAAEKVKSLYMIYSFLLQSAKEPDIALMVGKRMLEYGVDDAGTLEEIIMLPCLTAKDDADLMAFAAEAVKAYEGLEGGETARVCRMGALVAYQRGDTDTAVQLQERAVSLAENEPEEYQARLRGELQGFLNGVRIP